MHDAERLTAVEASKRASRDEIRPPGAPPQGQAMDPEAGAREAVDEGAGGGRRDLHVPAATRQADAELEHVLGNAALVRLERLKDAPHLRSVQTPRRSRNSFTARSNGRRGRPP
jgi:hypothetical protein